MKELILVKLGGSLITDKSKPYTVRQPVLNRLAKEIAESGCKNMIVGHGGGSFPHQSASKYQTHRGIINEHSKKGIVMVQKDAAKLNSIVVDTFHNYEIDAIPLQPSASVNCKNCEITKWDMGPIRRMLKCELIPVPYGDVALDEKTGCCIISTEKLLSYLAEKLGGKRIIIVGKVDGVMTADPNKDRRAELIKEITPKNFSGIKKSLTGSDGVDVTGGMLSKVESMLELAKLGIESEIINGDKPGYLKRALMGERGLGTVIKR